MTWCLLININITIICGVKIWIKVVHGWKCCAYPHFAFHRVKINVPNPYSNKALQDVSYHRFCQWYSLCQILLPCKFVFVGHNPNILKLVEWNFERLENTCIKKLEFMKGVGQYGEQIQTPFLICWTISKMMCNSCPLNIRRCWL